MQVSSPRSSAPIALQNGFFPLLCPLEFKRSRTAECEGNALDMLEAYRDFGKISQEEYERREKEIKSAPHDDAISDIMTKIRNRIKW
jgi:hypothetical protein